MHRYRRIIAAIVVLLSLCLSPASPVHAQDEMMSEGAFCGEWGRYRLDPTGITYNALYTSTGTLVGIVSPEAGETCRPLIATITLIHEPHYDATVNVGGQSVPLITSMSSCELVPSCNDHSTPSLEMAPAEMALPTLPQCSSKMRLTVSELPKAWQQAAKKAMNSWNKSGADAGFAGPNGIEEAKRSLIALSLKGEPISWDRSGEPLKLAMCEVRVVLLSNFTKADLAALRSLGQVNNMKPSWVQTYAAPDAPDHEYGALIVINDLLFDFTADKTLVSPTVLDLQSLMLHEIGHSLGLNHVSDRKAVMTGAVWDHVSQRANGFKRRALTQSDIDQLVRLYGAN